ncbi:transposase [Iamia sp. SCSIO 61187]|nr:transposase [Iamia sp. SCSIO 61187]
MTIYRSINALAESTIGLYKTELVRPHGPWHTLGDLELATLGWVHWFNEVRLHSSLGYLPPVEFEDDYYRHLNPRDHPVPGEPSLH